MSPALSSRSTTLDMALWVMGVRSPSCFKAVTAGGTMTLKSFSYRRLASTL